MGRAVKAKRETGTASDLWYNLSAAGNLLGCGRKALADLADSGDLPVLEHRGRVYRRRLIPAALVRAAVGAVHGGDQVDLAAFARDWAQRNVNGRLAVIVHGLTGDLAAKLAEFASEHGLDLTGMPDAGPA